MERILRYPDIEMVRPGDFLPDGNVVLVQMTMNVIDVVIGADLRNDQWDTNPFETEYRVWTALAPRVKVDKNDKCGVVHGS